MQGVHEMLIYAKNRKAAPDTSFTIKIIESQNGSAGAVATSSSDSDQLLQVMIALIVAVVVTCLVCVAAFLIMFKCRLDSLRRP